MAHANRKRRRRHRGTQAGTIERAGRTSRPSGERQPQRGGARAATAARPHRLDRPPTLKGSVMRAAIAAVVVGIAVALTSKKPIGGVPAGVLVFFLYVPMVYYVDRAMYRRRQRKRAGG